MGMMIDTEVRGGIYYYEVKNGLSPSQWEDYVGKDVPYTPSVIVMTPLPIVFLEHYDEAPTLNVWQTASGGPAFLEFVGPEGVRSLRVYNHPFALIEGRHV